MNDMAPVSGDHLGGTSPSEIQAALSDVFGVGFRVNAANRSIPFYTIYHEDKVVAAIDRIDSLYLQSGAVWSDVEGGPAIIVEERLQEIRSQTSMLLRIPIERVVALLWMTQGIPESLDPTDHLAANVVCSAQERSLEDPVRQAMARAVSRLPSGPSPDLCRAFSDGAGLCATDAGAPTAAKLSLLLSAFEVILAKPEAIGDRRMVALGNDVSIRDIADPRYLLPAVAMAAHEDWRVATTKRVNGTGFTVRLEVDPKSLLGYRVTDLHPAVPYVVIAPMVALLVKYEKDGIIVLDEIIHQFRRWAVKNGVDGQIFSVQVEAAA